MKKVEVTATIKTKPDTIIAAFVNPEHLKQWWQVERLFIDTEIDGIYALTWKVTDAGYGYVTVGNVKEYDPNNKLVITNLTYMNPEKAILGEMTLTVIAKQNGSNSVLYLCQEGYQKGGDWDWYYESVKAAWPEVVQTLKNYLESL